MNRRIARKARKRGRPSIGLSVAPPAEEIVEVAPSKVKAESHAKAASKRVDKDRNKEENTEQDEKQEEENEEVI